MTDRDADIATIDRFLAQLSEHFDAIEIFATRHNPHNNESIAVNHGIGNWYARHGQVRDYVAREAERARIAMRDE